MENYPEIRENFARVTERIAVAGRAAGRSPQDVKLVVVTKGQPVPRIQAALAAGAQHLGENYVEEAADKLLEISPAAGVEWRMIGHLQSNKARQAAGIFNTVDSLDSLKLAGRLNLFAGEHGRILPVLLEFNLSGESSKTGWPAWDEEEWPALRHQLAALLDLPHLCIQGLMTMPPYFEEPELAAPYFRKLCRLQGFLQNQLPAADWSELSMGMSGDYEVAVREGATMVRVGTAIMGSRAARQILK